MIDAELLDSARKLVDWFTLYAETFVRNRIADNYQETKLNKVKQLITAAGPAGITRSDLLRKTQSIGKKDLDELLDRLIESEEIAKETRPAARGTAATAYRCRSRQLAA